MTTLPGDPPPNWYPDPAGGRAWRFWDGERWTEHTAPMQEAGSGARTTALAVGPTDPVHWLLPVGRSGESIAAGYLGLICLILAWVAILPFAFVAMLPLAGLTAWLAIRALGKASAGGHGRGRAVFGLIGAGAATLGSLGGAILTFAPS